MQGGLELGSLLPKPRARRTTQQTANVFDAGAAPKTTQKGKKKAHTDLPIPIQVVCHQLAFDILDPHGTGSVPNQILDDIRCEIARLIRIKMEAREEERFSLEYGREALLEIKREEKNAERGTNVLECKSDIESEQEDDEDVATSGDENFIAPEGDVSSEDEPDKTNDIKKKRRIIVETNEID